MAQSAQRQQVQWGQPVGEEKHCSHCGTSHTSSSWRRHPPSGQRICKACRQYADEHSGQLPPDSVLQRRSAQPRQMEDVRRDMAQRLCLHCGSASPGGKGAFWRRHPATGEEWVCTPCHGRALPWPTQRRGGEGERPAMVTQPSSQAGPAAAARKRARGQQQQSRQQQPAAGAVGGGAVSEPAAKRRRKQASPQRQPPPQVQLQDTQLAGPAALADPTDHEAEAGGAAAAVVAPAARAGPAGAVPGGRLLASRAGAEPRAAALAAAAGVVGQLGQALPATGQVEQQQDAAEPDLYSLLQEAAEQAAAAASGLTAELAAAVAAALPLEPRKEAYLRRLLQRHQYSAAAAFMEVVLRGGGHLPPAT